MSWTGQDDDWIVTLRPEPLVVAERTVESAGRLRWYCAGVVFGVFLTALVEAISGGGDGWMTAALGAGLASFGMLVEATAR